VLLPESLWGEVPKESMEKYPYTIYVVAGT
jgi:hypothetical protein